MNTTQSVRSRAIEIKTSLSEWRRDFHKHPELGWMEFRTTKKIASYLKNLGYEVLTGADVCDENARMGVPGNAQLAAHARFAESETDRENDMPDMPSGGLDNTGVIASLHCGDGPTVALRFDMDALPITEPDVPEHIPGKEGFSSCNPGTMHACGHDGHMAIGLGTARILAENKAFLHGTVKLIFQPAEEGVRGARSIVEKGHLDDVHFLLAAHIMPSSDGTAYIAPGMEGTFATTKLQAIFHGKSAHAAMAPEGGNNALLAAAGAVLNLQAIPRHSGGSSRINVGSLHAGKAANVICDEAEMLLEVRGETAEINRYMENYACRILSASAAMHGCELTVKKAGAALTVKCSETLTKRIRKICSDKLQIPVRISPGLGASEDFSFMTDHVLSRGGRTCFIGIHVPVTAPLHSPSFDFDEEALVMGTALFASVVTDLLNPEQSASSTHSAIL